MLCKYYKFAPKQWISQAVPEFSLEETVRFIFMRDKRNWLEVRWTEKAAFVGDAPKTVLRRLEGAHCWRTINLFVREAGCNSTYKTNEPVTRPKTHIHFTYSHLYYRRIHYVWLFKMYSNARMNWKHSTLSPFVTLLPRRAQSGRWSSFGKLVWFTESHIVLIISFLLLVLFTQFILDIK